jgi:signal transduction histidine kinase
MRESRAAGPAETSVTAAAARFAVAARTVVVIACTALLPVGGAGKAAATLVPAVLAWQAGCVAAGRSRLAAATDCLPLAAACVLLPWLDLPHGHLDLDDWARPVTSVCVGAAQFSTGPRTGTVYTCVVAAAVGLGSMMATAGDWDLHASQATMVLWQGALARCLMVLLARSARHLDESTAATAAARREADLSAARRADVAEHLAALHDTVAATLTAAASPGAAGPELRQRARSDLSRLKPAASFADLRTPPETGTLRITVAPATAHDSPAIPPSAMNALVAARDEALRNVERHAGTGEARLEVRMPSPNAVELDVVDHGRGFSPSDVAQGEHLGLRLSIEERMRRAGGSARVVSAPGRGTRVELRWPAA